MNKNVIKRKIIKDLLSINKMTKFISCIDILGTILISVFIRRVNVHVYT